jgi:hypothetical protein
MINPDMPLDQAFANTGAARRSGLCKIAENIETNRARAKAGHPPVHCQLTGEEAQAISISLASLAVASLTAGMKGDRTA